jgi:hypothetical protein
MALVQWWIQDQVFVKLRLCKIKIHEELLCVKEINDNKMTGLDIYHKEIGVKPLPPPAFAKNKPRKKS